MKIIIDKSRNGYMCFGSSAWPLAVLNLIAYNAYISISPNGTLPSFNISTGTLVSIWNGAQHCSPSA